VNLTTTVWQRLSTRRQVPPAIGPVILTQNRVYILPTSGGLIFGATLVVMLLGCVNYNLGLGYVLTFLLAGVAVVALLHTFRNLAHLRVLPGRAQPVFAGDTAVFPVLLDNPSRQARYAVAVSVADDLIARGLEATHAAWVDIAPGQQATALLRLHAAHRGRLALPRLRVASVFPLGLFRAWAYVHLDAHCIVYPRPEGGEVPLPPPRSGKDDGLQSAHGTDDFAGLRNYHAGDSLRHIAWKAVARNQPLMTKQFDGLSAGQVRLSWNDTPAHLRPEARIARMARWVVDASRAGVPFAMELPGAGFASARGAAHEARCLTALALLRIRG
jgi:uncharacterized protein (DUF58 family)